MAGVRLPKSFQSFAFNGWKYTDERQKWKEKVQKNTHFRFCGQTKAFRYEIVILGIPPCSRYGWVLAYFGLTKAPTSLKKFQVGNEVYAFVYTFYSRWKK